jgi:hypothetical protein
MKDELFRNIMYLEDLNSIKLYIENGLTDNQFNILNNIIYRIKNVEILYYFIENEKILTYLMESIFMSLFIKNDLVGIKKIIDKGITDKLISVIRDVFHENKPKVINYILSIPEIKEKVLIKFI